MRILLTLLILTIFSHAKSILVLNSNDDVEKYNETIVAFEKSFESPFKILDITDMKSKDIKESLYEIYPDVVYTVGVKAYQYANKYIPEKEIFFSSIINYKRLPLNSRRYGISNEIHSGMELTIIKSVFSDIKSIGVVYSNYTKDIVAELKKNASTLGVTIIEKKVEKGLVKAEDLEALIKESDSILILADPLFLSDKNLVENFLKNTQKYKKPVIAYNKLFIPYGASLVVSIDNPTTGRQVATMIDTYLSPESIETKIQYPAGTKVIFNKKLVELLNINYNKSIAYIANEIIE